MEQRTTIKKNQEVNSKYVLNILLKARCKGWRDDSSVTSMGCSSVGPGFNSQKQNGITQPSVSSVAEYTPHATKHPYT